MDQYGAITIVCHPHTYVRTTYRISRDDGRLSINEWVDFIRKERRLVMGDVLLMMLYLGDKGLFLFVSDVPKLPAE